MVPVGGHTVDNMVKQLHHGGLGADKGVCGRGEGCTLTTEAHILRSILKRTLVIAKTHDIVHPS